MNSKIIALFLVIAVLGTVFVSGCVTDDSGTSETEQQQETTVLAEVDDVWIDDSDDIEIGEMY